MTPLMAAVLAEHVPIVRYVCDELPGALCMRWGSPRGSACASLTRGGRGAACGGSKPANAWLGGRDGAGSGQQARSLRVQRHELRCMQPHPPFPQKRGCDVCFHASTSPPIFHLFSISHPSRRIDDRAAQRGLPLRTVQGAVPVLPCAEDAQRGPCVVPPSLVGAGVAAPAFCIRHTQNIPRQKRAKWLACCLCVHFGRARGSRSQHCPHNHALL